jgi:hypothetical protein
MKNKNYILLTHFCQHTSISDSFLKSLIDYNLISYKEMENDFYILDEEITEIERMHRLHDDLGINLEGLDVIKEMLNRLQKMEEEMAYLKKRLNIYE